MSANPSDVGPMLDPEDPTGPGAQLREARHRAKYSLEEMASRLHLDRRMVRALEENEFEKLPAATFVRGYIRNYARLLSLPPGPILEAFDHQGLAPPAIIADITQHPEVKSSDIPVRLATYLVAAGLVFMVVMWGYSREPAPAVGPSTDVVASTPLASEAPLDVAISTADDSGSPALPGPSESLGQDPVPSGVPGSPVAAIPATGGEVRAHQPEPLPPHDDTPVAIVAVATAPTVETAPSVEDSPALANATEERPVFVDAASADIPSGRLDLRFDNDSWVEVYDGNGNRLVYQLVKEGKTIKLSPTPPIKVILGFADGAELTLNGRAFDMNPFTRQSMARFIIGRDWVGEPAWTSAAAASRTRATDFAAPAAADSEVPAARVETPIAADSEAPAATRVETPIAADSEAPTATRVETPIAADSETSAVAAPEVFGAGSEASAVTENVDDVLSRH